MGLIPSFTRASRRFELALRRLIRDAEENWKTINGTHVNLENGKGPENLKQWHESKMASGEWKGLEQEKGAGKIGASEPIMEEEDDPLASLFAEIESGEYEKNKREREEKQAALEKEVAERRAYGQFGLAEKEFPEKLRLTGKERDDINDVLRSYRESSHRTRVSTDVIEALNGRQTLGTLNRHEEELKTMLKEADEMIDRRKSEGYKGESRLESWQRWQRLRRELSGASEHERGEILGSAAIGENGIQYWQRLKKEAQGYLDDLDLAKKIVKRHEFAQKEEHYMPWRDNPNATDPKYKPWETKDSFAK